MNAPTNAAHSAHARLAWLLAAWLLDYRALEGDQLALPLQVCGALVSFVCAGSYLLSRRQLATRPRRLVQWALLFIAFAAAVGVARGQAPLTILTIAMPLLLFIGGVALTFDALAVTDDPNRTRVLILRIALAAVVLKPFLHYYTTQNFALSEVRFQIISGAMVLIMAHCVLALFVRFRAADFFIFSVVVLILAAAVTRGYLLVGIGMVASNIVFAVRSVRNTSFLRSTLLVGIALLVLSIALADSWEVVLERWQDRLTKQDDLEYDITTASRLAEVAFQMETITSSVDYALFGSGMAAPTQGVGEYADFFFALFPDQELFSIGFGHNGPVSLLYVGGWIMGGMALVVLIMWFWYAGAFIKRHLHRAAVSPLSFIGCWSSTSIVGALIVSLTSGIFTQRSDSLYLGVSVGMLLWAKTIDDQRAASD